MEVDQGVKASFRANEEPVDRAFFVAFYVIVVEVFEEVFADVFFDAEDTLYKFEVFRVMFLSEGDEQELFKSFANIIGKPLAL